MRSILTTRVGYIDEPSLVDWAGKQFSADGFGWASQRGAMRGISVLNGSWVWIGRGSNAGYPGSLLRHLELWRTARCGVSIGKWRRTTF